MTSAVSRRGQTVTRGTIPPIALVAWFGLAVAPVACLIGFNGDVTLALRLTAIASLLGGFLIFSTHGGRHITASGMFCLASGIMNGGGAWYWTTQVPPGTTREGVLIAALSVYVTTCVMYLVFWLRGPARRQERTESLGPIRPNLTRSIGLYGAMAFILGAFAANLGLELGTLAQCAAEVGVILVAASLLLNGNVHLLRSPMRTAAAGAALVVFYLVVFSGGGRLRLAAVPISVAVMAQYRLRTPVKRLALAVLFPTILLFAAIGRARVAAQTSNTNLQDPTSGLGSLVNPLVAYAQLIGGHITGGYGSTFVAEAVAIIPRAIWPGKPVQFGALLVPIFRPDLVGTDFSMAFLAQGEWYYNFSWFGLPLMVLILGPTLRWLDDHLIRSGQGSLDRRTALWAFLGLSILAGSITDLAWGGVATWAVRNTERLLVLLPLLLWSLFIDQRTQHVLTGREEPLIGRIEHKAA